MLGVLPGHDTLYDLKRRVIGTAHEPRLHPRLARLTWPTYPAPQACELTAEQASLSA